VNADIIARVRELIADTGRSQREIAEAIGIDGPKLSKSLSGRRNFSSYELAALADLGGRTVDWLLDGKEPRVFSFAHRTEVSEPTVVDLAGQEIVEGIGERFDSAIRLGLLTQPEALPLGSVRGTDVDRGLALASAALDRLADSIADVPTWELSDRIDETFGVNVVVAELPDGVDGLSYQDGAFRIIVLDSSERVGRQRFTLAHELGHVLMGDAEDLHRSPRGPHAPGSSERRANAFAAAFLAPDQEVRVQLAGRAADEQFDRLAWTFWLAPDALAWRLFNLGLIDAPRRLELGRRSQAASARAIGMEREHARRVIQAKVLRPPMRLTDAFLKAFIAGEVAARAVTQLTGLSEGTLHSMLNDFEGLTEDRPSDWDGLV